MFTLNIRENWEVDALTFNPNISLLVDKLMHLLLWEGRSKDMIYFPYTKVDFLFLSYLSFITIFGSMTALNHSEVQWSSMTNLLHN